VAEEESRRKGSASELLGNWRAAERDLIAARDSVDVATLAAAAAEVAVVAARETSEAARLGADAAQRAARSALRTAEAAEVTARAAKREETASEDVLRASTQAEADAGTAYHDAQELGFPKD
jgi:hypothetical protein